MIRWKFVLSYQNRLIDNKKAKAYHDLTIEILDLAGGDNIQALGICEMVKFAIQQIAGSKTIKNLHIQEEEDAES